MKHIHSSPIILLSHPYTDSHELPGQVTIKSRFNFQPPSVGSSDFARNVAWVRFSKLGWRKLRTFASLGGSLDRVCVKGYVFSSVLTAYHRAARLVKLLVSIKTELCYVRADAKPKRRQSAAKISVI